jgi:sigma-B regulation protein RsbU (phosphoserine phosphatase)
MLIKRSITVKAVCLFLLISTIILAVVYLYSYLVSRKIIVDLAEENSRAHGGNVAHLITSKIRPIEKIVSNIAISLENPELSDEAIIELTKGVIEGNESVFGAAIAFEPFGMFSERLYFAPYSYRTDEGLSTMYLGNTDYRYFHHDWYQLPKLLEQPVWTEPYFDTGGGNILMVTFAAPFYREQDGERRFAGIVTADVSLAWLQAYISDIKLYESGYATLLSGTGMVISHPSKNLVLNETIFSLAEALEDEQLWEIGRDAVAGGTGFLERTRVADQKKSFVYYRSLAIGGWSLLFLFPQEEVLGEITSLGWRTLAINLLGFVVLSLAIIWLTRKFTRPIINLSQSAKEIARGNLNAAIPTLDSNDELGDLTTSFSEMQDSLNHHIEELTKTTASKERIESELRIARNIQMSILPKIFPPFPDRKEFDVFSLIRSAKEVGGDLYDFFFLDEQRFCFLIGDVSDKGVPAAFFMAVTKTLLKVIAEQYPDPGDILTKVNNDLAEGNESCMFVTLFIAIIDLKTGRVQAGNAGHNPPVLLTRDSVSYLPSPHEPVAGAMGDLVYTTQEFALNSGDYLMLYTDGVTEAMDITRQCYSDERLLDTMEIVSRQSPEQIVRDLEKSVSEFAGDAEQSDDITMLCLRYNGPADEVRGEKDGASC